MSTEESGNYVIFNNKLVDSILDYLTKHAYEHVAHIIVEILKQSEENTPEMFKPLFDEVKKELCSEKD